MNRLQYERQYAYSFLKNYLNRLGIFNRTKKTMENTYQSSRKKTFLKVLWGIKCAGCTWERVVLLNSFWKLLNGSGLYCGAGCISARTVNKSKLICLVTVRAIISYIRNHQWNDENLCSHHPFYSRVCSRIVHLTSVIRNYVKY